MGFCGKDASRIRIQEAVVTVSSCVAPPLVLLRHLVLSTGKCCLRYQYPFVSRVKRSRVFNKVATTARQVGESDVLNRHCRKANLKCSF